MEILDEDNVLRRVPTFLPNYFKPDGSITRVAFSTKKDEDGLSVNLERLTTVEKSILNPSKFKLFKINVGVVKNEINDDLDVVYNPKEDNEAHCLITGNITKGKANQLKKNANEVNLPEK